MICRVAVHEQPSRSIRNEGAASFRRWMREQPGFRGGWHAQDPVSGRIVSISLWESQADLDAMKCRTPPGGPVGMAPARVDVFTIVEEF